MSVKIEINKDEYKELVTYCELNNLDVVQIVRKCFLEGYRIEKYGLLSNSNKREPEVQYIETIKEVPKIEYVEVTKEVIKEVPKIEYVEVEKVVEVIKEVPTTPIEVEVIKYVDREVIKEVFIEKDVSNVDNISDKNYISELEREIEELKNKPPEIKEVPVEIIKEVIVEKISPKETIKEIIVEKSDENLKNKFDLLQNTLMKVRGELIERDKKIKELEEMINKLKPLAENRVAFLRGSNLDKTI